MLFGYSRISTSEQKETSLEVQEQFHESLARSLNQQFKSIREVGSGKDSNRPELQKLINVVREGDIVSFYDTSRLGRSTSDNLQIAKSFISKGVKVYISGREYRIDQATDELTFSLESAVATYSRRLQRDKQLASQNLQRARGDYIFGTLYGFDQYKKKGKHYAEFNENSAKVKEAYERFLKGELLSKIAIDLQIPLPSLMNFLNNPIYAGHYFDTSGMNINRRFLSNEELKAHLIKSNIYKPIISLETFLQFRELYRKNHKTKDYTYRKSAHELSGVYKCTCCGAGFSFIQNKTVIMGKSYYYTYYENSFPRVACRRHKKITVKADKLEKLTEAFLIIALRAGVEVAGFFAETKNTLLQNAQDLQVKNDALLRDIEVRKERISRIKSLILDGTIEPEDFKEDMTKLKEEISSLERSIEENKRIIDYKDKMIEDVLEEEAKDNLDEFLNSDVEGKRDFFKRFVKEAFIYSKNKLSIEFINTKRFTYEDDKFEVWYLGEKQFDGSFIKGKVMFNKISEEDEFRAYVNQELEKIAKEVNELITL